MFLLQKLSAVAWHVLESIADVLEHVVGVHLSTEFNPIYLNSWISVSSKIRPLLWVLFQDKILIICKRKLTLAFKTLFYALINICSWNIDLSKSSVVAFPVNFFRWTQLMHCLDVFKELIHLTGISIFGSHVPDASLMQIFHHNCVSIVFSGCLVVLDCTVLSLAIAVGIHEGFVTIRTGPIYLLGLEVNPVHQRSNQRTDVLEEHHALTIWRRVPESEVRPLLGPWLHKVDIEVDISSLFWSWWFNEVNELLAIFLVYHHCWDSYSSTCSIVRQYKFAYILFFIVNDYGSLASIVCNIACLSYICAISSFNYNDGRLDLGVIFAEIVIEEGFVHHATFTVLRVVVNLSVLDIKMVRISGLTIAFATQRLQKTTQSIRLNSNYLQCFDRMGCSHNWHSLSE